MNEKDEMRKNITTLKKIFSYLPKIEEDNIIPSDKLVGYMDPSNVLMIIPKTYFLKTIITQDFDVKETKIPSIDYNNKSGAGSYCVGYLAGILPLLKNTCGTKIKIQCNEDMPMILETKEVKIFIAPKMFNGEF